MSTDEQQAASSSNSGQTSQDVTIDTDASSKETTTQQAPKRRSGSGNRVKFGTEQQAPHQVQEQLQGLSVDELTQEVAQLKLQQQIVELKFGQQQNLKEQECKRLELQTKLEGIKLSKRKKEQESLEFNQSKEHTSKMEERLKNDPKFAKQMDDQMYQDYKQQLQLDSHKKRLEVMDGILKSKTFFESIGFTQATRESVMPNYRYTSIQNPNENLKKINSFDSVNNLDSDMNSRMAIGNNNSVASAAQHIDYVSDLSLFSITKYLQSRKYLHGRYLEENGSISVSTDPIFKFKDDILDATRKLQIDNNNTVDLDKYKYLLMNDYISKEENQITTQNEFQSEMVKSSYLSVNVRLNVFAFCFGASGGSGGSFTSGSMDNQSSNQANIYESTQFIRARVTITPQCLEYTESFKQDLHEMLDKEFESERQRYNEWHLFKKKYGDFFITESLIGGTIFNQHDMSSQSIDSAESSTSENKESASGAGFYGGAAGSGSREDEHGSEEKSKTKNRDKNISSELQCRGGDPSQATTSSKSQWEKSLSNYRTWENVEVRKVNVWYSWLPIDIKNKLNLVPLRVRNPVTIKTNTIENKGKYNIIIKQFDETIGYLGLSNNNNKMLTVMACQDVEFPTEFTFLQSKMGKNMYRMYAIIHDTENNDNKKKMGFGKKNWVTIDSTSNNKLSLKYARVNESALFELVPIGKLKFSVKQLSPPSNVESKTQHENAGVETAGQEAKETKETKESEMSIEKRWLTLDDCDNNNTGIKCIDWDTYKMFGNDYGIDFELQMAIKSIEFETYIHENGQKCDIIYSMHCMKVNNNDSLDLGYLGVNKYNNNNNPCVAFSTSNDSRIRLQVCDRSKVQDEYSFNIIECFDNILLNSENINDDSNYEAKKSENDSVTTGNNNNNNNNNSISHDGSKNEYALFMSRDGSVSFHQLSNCDLSNEDGYKWKFYATVDNKATIKNVTTNQYLSLNVHSGNKYEIIGISSKFGVNLIKFNLNRVTSPENGITTNVESKKKLVSKWDGKLQRKTKNALDIKIFQEKYIRHPKFQATHIQIEATRKENKVNKKKHRIKYIRIDELLKNNNIIQLREYSGIEEFTLSAVNKSNSNSQIVSNKMRFYHNFDNYKFNLKDNKAKIELIESPGQVQVKLTLNPKSKLYKTIYATKILFGNRDEMEMYLKTDIKHKTKDSIKTTRLWKITPVDNNKDKDNIYIFPKTINDKYEFICEWDKLKVNGDRFECQSCICYGKTRSDINDNRNIQLDGIVNDKNNDEINVISTRMEQNIEIINENAPVIVKKWIIHSKRSLIQVLLSEPIFIPDSSHNHYGRSKYKFQSKFCCILQRYKKNVQKRKKLLLYSIDSSQSAYNIFVPTDTESKNEVFDRYQLKYGENFSSTTKDDDNDDDIDYRDEHWVWFPLKQENIVHDDDNDSERKQRDDTQSAHFITHKELKLSNFDILVWYECRDNNGRLMFQTSKRIKPQIVDQVIGDKKYDVSEESDESSQSEDLDDEDDDHDEDDEDDEDDW